MVLISSSYNRGVRILLSSTLRNNHLLSSRRHYDRQNYNYTINASRIMFSSVSPSPNTNNDYSEPSFENRIKPRVLILGSGWAGFTLPVGSTKIYLMYVSYHPPITSYSLHYYHPLPSEPWSFEQFKNQFVPLRDWETTIRPRQEI